MSLKPFDSYFLAQTEPERSCLEALRGLVKEIVPALQEEWKYGMPFFCIHGKMFCYLWVDKNTRHPYLGIVAGNKLSHPKLLAADRKKMKVLPINPNEDLPVADIAEILNQALQVFSNKL